MVSFPDLLPGRILNYISGDIGTSLASSGLARTETSLAARAIQLMTQMKDNGTLAFIGPDDTCSAEALVATAWNLPMISYVSLTLQLGKLYESSSMCDEVVTK